MDAGQIIEQLKQENANMKSELARRIVTEEDNEALIKHWKLETFKYREEACCLAGSLRDVLNCGNDQVRENAKQALAKHDASPWHNN